jgi:3' exoribonuclease, RNase T-like
MDRLFVSTKFTGVSPDAKLISIGLVDESSKHKFYAEPSDTWQPSDASEFTQREVIPHLEGGASCTPMGTLKKHLAAWIRGLRVPVMLATDSLQRDWPWMEALLKQRWPENLARDPLLLTTDYLYEFDAFEAAREAAFTSGLRRHHALDNALANRQAWYTSGGDIRDEGGLPMLKARQRKDAEEVKAGRRDPRSLLAVGKGDLKGASFTLNPESEFKCDGRGW